jgi:hypothetical protein
MNIFNRCYFSDASLCVGVKAALSGLNEGGFWIVGRTMEDEQARNDVTVFQKQGSQLAVVCRMGFGSEIEDLVLDQTESIARLVQNY